MSELPDKLIQDAGAFNRELEATVKTLKEIASSIKDLAPAMNGALHGTASGSGIGAIGLGSTGGNILGGSMGKVGYDLFKGSLRWSKSLGIASGAMKMLGGTIGGVMQGLPDVSATIGMATGYYNAAVMSGGASRYSVGRQTITGLGRGLTSPADAVAGAQILTSMGIYAGGTRGIYGGGAQYGSILNAMSGAARYLNINNAQSAQAIGGLYSGSTSMGLLQNFGIYTTNPSGGKSSSPLQILAMLNNRMTGGGRMTASQVKTALGPGGMLTADIQSSGLDQTQQTMLRQYMLDASRGKYWNEQTYGANMANKAGGNPQQAAMDIQLETAKTMHTVENQYIRGMKDAAKQIKFLESSVRGLVKQFPGLARVVANVETVAQNNVAQGAMSIMGGLIGGGISIASNIIGARNISKLAKTLGVFRKGVAEKVLDPTLRNGSKALSTVEKAAMSPAASLAKGMGLTAEAGASAVASLGMAYGDAYNAPTDKGHKKYNAMIVEQLSNAHKNLGNYFSPTEFATGGFARSGTNQAPFSAGAPGGGGGSVAAGVTSDTNKSLKLIHPVGRAKVGTRFGQTDGLHPAGHHGVDFIVPTGTPVQAAADGTVTFAGGNAKNTMGTNNRTLGLQVMIDHGNGYSTVYGHLSAYSVYVGSKVKAGQQIATSGNSGYSTGAHLHFELRRKGTPVDPSSALGSNYSAVSVGNNMSTVGAKGGVQSSVTSELGGNMSPAGALGYSSGAWKGSFPSAYSGAGIGSVAKSIASMGGAVNGVGGSGGSRVAAIGSGSGGGADTAPMSKGGPVTINVNVQSASESEARRMATIIKDYLEQDKLTNSMRMM